MTPLEQEIVSKLIEADYDDGNHPIIDEVIAMLRGPEIAVPYTVENYVKLAKHLTDGMDTESLRTHTYAYHLNGYEKSERQFREDYARVFGDTDWGLMPKFPARIPCATDINGLTPGVDYTHGDYCPEHDCHALQCSHSHTE